MRLACETSDPTFVLCRSQNLPWINELGKLTMWR